MAHLSIFVAPLAMQVATTAGATPDGVVVSLSLHKSDDLLRGGRGIFYGTVKRDADPADLPLRRLVRLHRDLDGLVVRETWSDPLTGDYVFSNIDPTIKYTAIAYYYENRRANGDVREFRAEAADNISPEVVPWPASI